MRTTTNCLRDYAIPGLRLLLAALFLLAGGTEAGAWDTDPDENGKYDDLYDRPTHFMDWSQPSTWPNAMYCLCEVRARKDDTKVQNYEIAVYDQNDQLRHCSRSIATDNDLCVLTIRGTEGDTFHFSVIYGEDFDNPTVAEVSDVTLSFKTNEIVGSKQEPFCLIIDVEDKETTDISFTPQHSTLNTQHPTPSYTLDGRRVQTSNLKKGIYILGNKKIVVK